MGRCLRQLVRGVRDSVVPQTGEPQTAVWGY